MSVAIGRQAPSATRPGLDGASLRPEPLRVCIAAEHASIRFGGEASLPFHYFRVLRARGIDAWLLVHERTRAELLESFPGDTGRLIFIPNTLLHKVFYRCGQLLPRRIGEATFGLANQYLTQRAQRRMLPGLLTANSVIHQAIPVSPRTPSLLCGLPAAVVIGPMNGGMDYPPAFRTAEFWPIRTAIAIGRAVSGWFNTLLPGKRDADLLLVANPRTREALPVVPRGRVVQLVENGVDLNRWPRQPSRIAVSNRFLFMGRLVDWKALDIVLHALKDVPEAQLDVVGDGAMRKRWEQLVRDLGLTARVHFLGWRTQTECAELLAEATALVLPSIFESGGAVILEAMSIGRPVIATRWGGPEDYLDEDCGILVDPTSQAALIGGFATAMQRLLKDADLCRALGENGRKKVEEIYDWEKKVDTVLDLYTAAQAAHATQSAQTLQSHRATSPEAV